MKVDFSKFQWEREPESYEVKEDCLKVVTKANTDLWQRTYYHFQNDNAPVYQMATTKKYFSFVVKIDFDYRHRFDQCGVVVYLDSENWLKASIENEDGTIQHLGSVVTNHGYSDWATQEIPANVTSMWYRLSRREDDFRVDCSEDGIHFKQMRICHLWEGKEDIRFGVYACSPEKSSFPVTFSNMEVLECQWLAHDGQQPGVNLME